MVEERQREKTRTAVMGRRWRQERGRLSYQQKWMAIEEKGRSKCK